MTESIRLTEYRDERVRLDDEDAEFVLLQLVQRISIRREVRSEACVLNSGPFVGVVVLPSGRRLECYPKVPIRNLFQMLAVAWKIDSPFRDEEVGVDRLDELLDFIVVYFAELVERRIDAGLYRTYVEQEGNLAAVRGRISVAEDIRHNYILRHRTWCRYADFTWDVPENQVIRQVVHLVGGWVGRPELRLRLRRLDATLAEVTPTNMPASAIGRFAYHRLNDDYQPIHRLCRLFIEGASLSEEEGTFDVRAFLVDMNRLFETFITEVLRELAPTGMDVRPQSQLFLGMEKKVEMRPDLIVEAEGQTVLVADCKYKRLEPDQFRHHDVYQLLAYCTASNVTRGLLIYPAHEVSVRDEVHIRNTSVSVQQTTIELGGSGEQLRQACDTLAGEVFSASGR